MAFNGGSISKAFSTGFQSVCVNTGNRSEAIGTGALATAISTGSYSAASVSNTRSVAISTGFQGKAKGEEGCWLVLAEYDEDTQNIIDVKSIRIDGKVIKANTYYTLQDGKFVETEEPEIPIEITKYK